MEKFIKMDAVARILSVAWSTGKNVLLYGPGGHAKSEFVSAWFATRGIQPFVQFFGEGMDEARLFGGLDFAKLNSGADAAIQYCVQRSFLTAEVAVFEELLDAPASVLLALKDTMTARELRNGAQRHPMATRVVVALTNKTPAEISEMGPSQAALMERFPLQLEVKWDAYDAGSYESLFQAVLGRPETVLAELIASAVAGGAVISPRSAIHAAQVLAAGTWQDLAFVPGLVDVASDLREQVEAAEARQAAASALRAGADALAQIGDEQESPIRALQAAKICRRIGASAEGVQAPDALSTERRDLIEKASRKANTLLDKALELTRV